MHKKPVEILVFGTGGKITLQAMIITLTDTMKLLAQHLHGESLRTLMFESQLYAAPISMPSRRMASS